MNELKEFVIYRGDLPVVTISDNKLSKVYRLEKGIPTPVADSNDKMILCSKMERKTTCSSCGKASISQVIFADETYCRYQKKNLTLFREEWTEYHEKQR